MALRFGPDPWSIFSNPLLIRVKKRGTPAGLVTAN